MSSSFNAALTQLMPSPFGSYHTEKGNVFKKEVQYQIHLPSLRSSMSTLKALSETDPKIQTLTPEVQAKIRASISLLESDLLNLDVYMTQEKPSRSADLQKDLQAAREEQSKAIQMHQNLIAEGNRNNYLLGALEIYRSRVESSNRWLETCQKRISFLENILNYTEGNGPVQYATDDDYWMFDSERIMPKGYSEKGVAYRITYHYDVKEGENTIDVDVAPMHLREGEQPDEDTIT
ncbi:MAG: hypothetical protein JSS60_04410 [Verrucomicrobia bacterium]|nr:hypothetical protein [Verrucomicrobiota bacterium]